MAGAPAARLCDRRRVPRRPLVRALLPGARSAQLAARCPRRERCRADAAARASPHFAPSQVVSLNVAVNSHNNVMLTLLVSNNFVELKSNVFKRFEPDNLFVLSCSDMIERFQLTCYLLIVALHVLTVHADSVVLANVLGAIGMVSAAELLVDWIKHAFVCLLYTSPSPRD